MGNLERELALEMERWEAAGLRRHLRPDGPNPAEVRVDFSSNDTLGLARHPEVIEAGLRALRDEGAGGRAARLLGGGGPAHVRAEQAAADWLGSQATLLLPSGYQANLALIGSLVGRGDALFSDARNHASLIDAARLSRARVFVHRHLDLEVLERQLDRAQSARRRLVVTEGVFSMQGDSPDLAALAALCARFDASLVVDEAHAAGLLGAEGAGAIAALGPGPWDEVLAARVVTGGKALGVSGAFIAGSRPLVDHVTNHGRAFIFTTAPTPATAGALARAIELLRDMDAERGATLTLARELAHRAGAPRPAAAIVLLPTAGPREAVESARKAREAGFDLGAVRPPTVPAGTAGLRVVLHATNTAEECERLIALLGDRPTAGSPSTSDRGPAPSMRRALFVVGTDTGIGKTVVSAVLLAAARRRGSAAYWKPVQTGDDSDTATVAVLAEACPEELLTPAFEFPLPASPHEAAAAAGDSIETERLESALIGALVADTERRLIVELAGGLLVPYRVEERGPRTRGGAISTQADWLERAAPPFVLVARSGLGTLNHTLLTLEALRVRHLEPLALFLVGVPHTSNRETLRELGDIAPIFELPPLDPLTPRAIADWLERTDLNPLFPL